MAVAVLCALTALAAAAPTPAVAVPAPAAQPTAGPGTGAPSSAHTSASARAPDAYRPLTIDTFPPVPGVRFRFADRVATTDDDGVATFSITTTERDALSEDRSSMLSVDTPTVPVGEDRRAVFSGWVGKGTYEWSRHSEKGAVEVAAFAMDRLVSFDFATTSGSPVAADRITSFRVRGRNGSDLALDPSGSHWLRATEPVMSAGGPTDEELRYAVTHVVVNGADVVNSGEQVFTPASSARVPVALLFFSVTFRTSDTLFGSPVGRSLLLRFPDRSSRLIDLERGRATVAELPRGSYEVTIKGGGPEIVRPLNISRSQVARLDVVSWLDIATIVGILGALTSIVLATALILRRRHRRRVRAQEQVEPTGGPPRTGAGLPRRVKRPAPPEPADVEELVP